MKKLEHFAPLLLILLFVALFISSLRFVERIQLEEENKAIELVLDYESFLELQSMYFVEEGPFLEEMARNGLTSIGFMEADLKSLLKTNRLIYTTPERLREIYYLTDSTLPFLEEGKHFLTGDFDGTFIFTPSPKVASFLLEGLRLRGEEEVRPLYQGESSYLFYVFLPSSKLAERPLGYVDDLTTYIDYGLRPLPRIKWQAIDKEENLIKIWEGIYQLPSTIIFGGGEVFGYEDSIDLTADLIRGGSHLLGVIEPFIAFQKGVKELALELDSRITRVHSLQQEEMENLSLTRVISRYLRAVRERNVRALYIRLFHDDNPVDENLSLIHDLAKALEGYGYHMGPAEPFAPFAPSLLRLFMVNLGVWSGLILLCHFFTKAKGPLLILFLFGVMFSVVTFLLGLLDFNRQIMGLLTAIVFPTWGVLLVLRGWMKEEMTEKALFSLFLQGLKSLGLATFITLLGGLLLVGIFDDLSYLMQLQLFRGIKLAFILPLLLIVVGFYYINRGLPWRAKDILQILSQPICFKHLLFGCALLLAAFVYLARTGNFPLLPVPELEILFRERLEGLMVFRPRFKEFLVGHPFFFLSFFFASNKKALPLFLLFGSIGQLSIMNSFAHLHTPLLVTLWRTGAGLLLSIPISLLLLLFFTMGSSVWERKKESFLS